MARVKPDKTILLQPRDALILRDARPFAADPGARAFSLQWPLPRTLTGALRSHMIRQSSPGTTWDHDARKAAHGYAVHGPLLVAQHQSGGDWRPYVAAAKDVVAMEDGTAMILRPDMSLPAGAGTDLPQRPEASSDPKDTWNKAMQNVDLRPMHVCKNGKPKKGVAAYWLLDDAVATLAAVTPDDVHAKALEAVNSGLHGPALQERVHVSVDHQTRTAVEGALFTTESREFTPDPVDVRVTEQVRLLRGLDDKPTQATPALGMLARVNDENGVLHQPSFATMGGERRLLRVSTADDRAAWPEPVVPDEEVLTEATGLRLQLVTPAIFAHGWLPGWMSDATVPGIGGCGLGVELVGVASDRPVPVSGYRLSPRPAKNGRPAQDAGPKETLLAVSAGSVYFFRITKGKLTEEIWRKLWLSPISDSEPHANEGFGLALPGIW